MSTIKYMTMLEPLPVYMSFIVLLFSAVKLLIFFTRGIAVAMYPVAMGLVRMCHDLLPPCALRHFRLFRLARF